jgi:hypothetical protein
MIRNALKYLEKFGDPEGLLKKLDKDRKILQCIPNLYEMKKWNLFLFLGKDNENRGH